MRLAVDLALRVGVVTALCLSTAAVWVMAEAAAGVRAEMQASAERVAREVRFDAWHVRLTRGPAASAFDVPAAEAPPARAPERWLRLIGPGVCVGLAPIGPGAPWSLCGSWGGIGPAAPAWFEALYAGLYAREAPLSRAVLVDGRPTGIVTAGPDADAAVRQVWQRLRASLGVAGAMAAGIAACLGIAITRALRPARLIAARLDRLDGGARAGAGPALPRFRTDEFDRIARAVDDLAARLAAAGVERAALMRRLFAVQEAERRTIARDLHDEFGQSLTASEALATAIEARAADRPDLAADARAISEMNGRMMAVLRSALAQLRPPDLDEIGLTASLDRLAAGCRRTGTACRVEVRGDLDDLAPHLGLTLYRVVQEGLTNALRHGRPRTVLVRAERGPDAVRLTVEDDGGRGAPPAAGRGDGPDGAWTEGGQGLVGLRQRLAAHGGEFDVRRAARGLRLVATLPLGLVPERLGA